MSQRRSHDSVVFQTGNSVAVRLVGDCRLPKGTRIREYRQGARIILEPVPGWPKSFRDAIGSIDHAIPRPRQDKKQRNPFTL